MEFSGPSLAEKEYRSKFVRVGERIHVTTPGDDRKPHKELAQEDNILALVEQLRDQNSSEVDAGMIFVDNIVGTLRVDDYSTTLDLPVAKVEREARARTRVVFQKQSPGYNVS